MSKRKKKNLQVFIGNTCKYNKGKWGYVIVEHSKGIVIRKDYGFKNDTSSYELDLIALCETLKCLSQLNPDLYKTVTIHSNSELIIKGYNIWYKRWIKNNYKNGNLKHIDLWKSIFALKRKHPKINVNMLDVNLPWRNYLNEVLSNVIKKEETFEIMEPAKQDKFNIIEWLKANIKYLPYEDVEMITTISYVEFDRREKLGIA